MVWVLMTSHMLTQERFVYVLCDICQANLSSAPTGTLCPTNFFCSRTLTHSLTRQTTINGNTSLGHNRH